MELNTQQTLDPTSNAVPTGSGRCQPDPFDPDSVICLTKINAEDRQGVSHFFGRNKKVTSSIPNEMFPLLCRTHYQEKQYRWQEDPVAFAAFQCDCVLATLGKMVHKTWTDEVGNVWPYWCGFELQLLKQSESKRATSTPTCPEWLQKLCDKTAAGHEEYACVGDRNGVRVSFEDLVLIVCAIKTWCLQNGCRLPPVEALPITIGMVDELDLEIAKAKTRAATRNANAAELDLIKSDRQSNVPKKNHQAMEKALKDAKAAHSTAQIAEVAAKEDADSSHPTIPNKRQTKKSRDQNAANLDSIDEDMDDIDRDAPLKATEPPRTSTLRKRLVLRLRKRKRSEEATSD